MSGGRVIHVLSSQPYDMYIGREMRRYSLEESVWANPYKVGRDGDLGEVLEKFEEHVKYLSRRMISNVDITHGVHRDAPSLREKELLALRGLTLACWCAPPKNGAPLTLEEPEVCHGQVLLRIAEEFAASDQT